MDGGSKHINTIFRVTGSVNLPVMLQCRGRGRVRVRVRVRVRQRQHHGHIYDEPRGGILARHPPEVEHGVALVGEAVEELQRDVEDKDYVDERVGLPEERDLVADLFRVQSLL